ncbi:MAG: EamA family transporter [Bacteroidales bacterium]|jgi:transporter family protein|nr:EamA family transporter [Bacteroidales bacterium]
MWLLLAFVSATLLGFYDTSKKAALKDNAVLPVLFLNTLFSTIIFSPFILDVLVGNDWFAGTSLETAPYQGEGNMLKAHLMVVVKAVIVLTSWIAGYFGIKHIPITIVGPINATRPVMVLVGAMLLFGERLNLCQWIGVLLSMLSIYLMSRSSKKENIDFVRNKWMWCVAIGTIMGAVSALYDKFIMTELSPLFVQSWFNLYQFIMMFIILMVVWYPTREKTTRFHWSWAIPLIAVFVGAADFSYFNALSMEDSMISVVSLIRRGSVLISFACGVIIFKERNLKAKIVDLLLILIGMIFVYFGSR